MAQHHFKIDSLTCLTGEAGTFTPSKPLRIVPAGDVTVGDYIAQNPHYEYVMRVVRQGENVMIESATGHIMWLPASLMVVVE